MARRLFSFSKLSSSAVLRTISMVMVVAVIASLTGLAGYRLGQRRSGGALIGQAGPVDFSLFWDAWNEVDANFYGDKPQEKRVDGAIAGMVGNLGDPYSLYLPPAEAKDFMTQLQGSFGGIGAELEMKNGLVTVVAPLEGSPAEKAGIVAQDIVAEVDGKTVANQTLDEVISKIRGEKGTEVTLTVIRAGATAPIKIVIKRDTITPANVKLKMLRNNEVAYVRLASFTNDSAAQLTTELGKVGAGTKGLILDLRNNPGGFVSSAASLLSDLLPDKRALASSTEPALQARTALIERDRFGKEEWVPAKDGKQIIPAHIPIIVLVNGGSASASEIVAGALRDYGVAQIVGTQSFGKGSEQRLFELKNKGSVKLTVRKWFTPKGVGIDKEGLKPDVIVSLPTGTTISSEDAQVSKALELIP